MIKSVAKLLLSHNVACPLFRGDLITVKMFQFSCVDSIRKIAMQPAVFEDGVTTAFRGLRFWQN
jgi:hypothetical protein